MDYINGHHIGHLTMATVHSDGALLGCSVPLKQYVATTLHTPLRQTPLQYRGAIGLFVKDSR
jgi:hypothetical protein